LKKTTFSNVIDWFKKIKMWLAAKLKMKQSTVAQQHLPRWLLTKKGIFFTDTRYVVRQINSLLGNLF
jgi:hypothetical protein